MVHNSNVTRTLAAMAFVFLFAFGAFADTRTAANIPFDFEFRGQAFTAGRYEVGAVQGFGVVTLTDPEGKQHATLGTPLGNPNVVSPNKLVFRYEGGKYQLSEVWLRGAGGKKVKTTERTPAMTTRHEPARLVEITIGD